MSRSLDFSVLGVPVTQGSMTAYKHPTTGAVVVTHQRSLELRSWRHDIATVAHAARVQAGLDGPQAVPVALALTFTYRRPPSHYNAAGQVLPRYVDRLPAADLDKLCRAVLDALALVLYDDDKRVTVLHAEKMWDSEPGVRIHASFLPF